MRLIWANLQYVVSPNRVKLAEPSTFAPGPPVVALNGMCLDILKATNPWWVCQHLSWPLHTCSEHLLVSEDDLEHFGAPLHLSLLTFRGVELRVVREDVGTLRGGPRGAEHHGVALVNTGKCMEK